MKTCTKCGECKALDAFALDATRPSGRRIHCRACRSVMSKEYASRNREYLKEKARVYYQNNRDHLLAKQKHQTPEGARKRALRQKRYCEQLTTNYVEQRLNLPTGIAPPELIEAKRLNILIKRSIWKELK